jgi:mannose-6-phosphate isomerase
MPDSIAYPLLFEPLFERGDGCDDMLRDYLCGSLPELPPATACSWELLDAPPQATTVRNGAASGRSLSDLTREWGTELVGRRHRPGQPFPVCLRLLQTGRQEQLLVYPERTLPSGPVSNTRFWYSLNATAEAVVMAGIHPAATRMPFMAQMNTPMLRQSLQVFHPERYDAFLAPGGRVHALGPGNLLIEVQERPVEGLAVSGWGAEDAVSEEATTAALAHVLFSDRQVRRLSRDAGPIRQTRRVPVLPQCPAFRIDEIRLCDHIAGRTVGTSFHAFLVVEGTVFVHCGSGAPVTVTTGRAVLIPAVAGDYRIEAAAPPARLLKVFLPE